MEKIEDLQLQLDKIEIKLDIVLRLLNHQGSFYKIIDGVQYKRYLLNLAKEYQNSGGRISINEIEHLLKITQKDGKISELEIRTLNYIEDNFNLTEPATKIIKEFLIKEKI